ncbi:DUF6293 family protein, partial [Halobium palmae]
MEYVHETEEKSHTVHERDLVAFAEEADPAFVTHPPTENRQSEYSRLRSAVVEPLTAEGYVDVRGRAGGSSRRSPTSTGAS